MIKSMHFHRIRIAWFVGVFFISMNNILSQEVSLFRLIPAQTILLPGDELFYGIMTKPALIDKKSAPVFHLILQDLNKNELRRWMIKPDASVFTSKIEMPLDLATGTYILSLALYDDVYSRILEEEDHTIHVLGQGLNALSVFAKNQNNNPIAFTSSEKLFTREQYCDPSSSVGLYTLVDSNLTRFDSYARHHANINWNNIAQPVNFQKQLTYRILPASINDLQLFYDVQTSSVTQVKYLDGQAGIVKMPDFKGIKAIQWVHVLSNAVESKITQNYPSLEWTKDDLVSITIDDIIMKPWYDKLQTRALLQNVFDHDTIVHRIAKPRLSEITADNEYDLSRYQPFESLTLFMKEIMLPIKVIEKARGKDLRLLMGISKAWFVQSPLLLIDGTIQPSITTIYDLSVQDVSSIKLYRNADLLLKHFGPMGRNGVIEVITKSRSSATATINLSGLTLPIARSTSTNSDRVNDFNSGGVQYFSSSSTERLCIPLNDETGDFVLSRYAWEADAVSTARKLIRIQTKN